MQYDKTTPASVGNPRPQHQADTRPTVEQPAWDDTWAETFGALTPAQQAEFTRAMLDAADEAARAGRPYHPVNSRPAG